MENLGETLYKKENIPLNELASFPNECKVVKIKSLYKKSLKTDHKSFRPILVLSLIFKVLEQVIDDQTMDFLSDNDVLYRFPIQFLSTDSYLSYFYGKITKGFNSGFLTVIVFIDLQKVYDATYHNILIKKCLFEVLMMSRSSGTNHISQTESL